MNKYSPIIKCIKCETEINLPHGESSCFNCGMSETKKDPFSDKEVINTRIKADKAREYFLRLGLTKKVDILTAIHLMTKEKIEKERDELLYGRVLPNDEIEKNSCKKFRPYNYTFSAKYENKKEEPPND